MRCKRASVRHVPVYTDQLSNESREKHLREFSDTLISAFDLDSNEPEAKFEEAHELKDITPAIEERDGARVEILDQPSQERCSTPHWKLAETEDIVDISPVQVVENPLGGKSLDEGVVERDRLSDILHRCKELEEKIKRLKEARAPVSNSNI